MTLLADRARRGLIALIFSCATCSAYSVLTHEALVDAIWDVQIKRVLLLKFPDATPAQLKEAHAYAYGGAVIQDSGFYPHGSYHFSDLTHYVRSGDFILALLSDSQTLDEYAFALGALSHYYGDNIGHRYGTNISEPLLYHKIKRKYGDFVTYTENPDRHLQTEYAFDVQEIAKANFAPQNYHDFIGFQVPVPLLERAFRKTYGFSLNVLYSNIDEAIGSYRYTLRTLIPFFTRVAWADHQDEIRRARPSITKKKFIFVMSRSNYERNWGKQYNRPSWFDRLLAFIVKLLPPIGPLKQLKFRPLTPAAQQIFMHSFDMAAPGYQKAVHDAGGHTLQLTNLNFDTGALTHGGQYDLQDQAFAFWLDKLAHDHFSTAEPPIRRTLLSFYADLNAPFDTKKHKKDWQRVLNELAELKAAAAR